MKNFKITSIFCFSEWYYEGSPVDNPYKDHSTRMFSYFIIIFVSSRRHRHNEFNSKYISFNFSCQMLRLSHQTRSEYNVSFLLCYLTKIFFIFVGLHNVLVILVARNQSFILHKLHLNDEKYFFLVVFDNILMKLKTKIQRLRVRLSEITLTIP